MNILFSGKENGKNSRESKSMKFDKRSFHIIKRKEHKTKIDNLLKQELDGAFDEDIVSFLVQVFSNI